MPSQLEESPIDLLQELQILFRDVHKALSRPPGLIADDGRIRRIQRNQSLIHFPGLLRTSRILINRPQIQHGVGIVWIFAQGPIKILLGLARMSFTTSLNSPEAISMLISPEAVPRQSSSLLPAR